MRRITVFCSSLYCLFRCFVDVASGALAQNAKYVGRTCAKCRGDAFKAVLSAVARYARLSRQEGRV
jgi:hypothetical protein